jgi:hypothetical protein
VKKSRANPAEGEEEHHQPDVLGVEGLSEEKEAAALDVQVDRGVSADREERHPHVDRDQRRVRHAAEADEAAPHVRRVQVPPRSVAADRVEALEAGSFRHLLTAPRP